jgi:hypothetical protein
MTGVKEEVNFNIKKMQTLLEDYKRKLKNVEALMYEQDNNGSLMHEKREVRLKIKAAEYRAFIVDIERAIERQQQQSSVVNIIDNIMNKIDTIEQGFKVLKNNCNRFASNKSEEGIKSNDNIHVVVPHISHFIDENGNNVDINADGVNVILSRDKTLEYYLRYGSSGRKLELTPVYESK